MDRRSWVRCGGSFSDNRKSKTCTEPSRSIKNPKWLGLSVIVFVLVAAGAVVQAQQPGKIHRIGFIIGSSSAAASARNEAFRQGLRELGYVEGKNISIEWRFADGKLERLPEFAAELVRLKVDLIVTAGSDVTRHAKEATGTIPIVMAQDSDPVGLGFVASLARPGGNITGLANYSPELSGKRLEILKEILPQLSTVSVLWNSSNPGSSRALKETEVAAPPMGLKLQAHDIPKADALEPALQAISKARSGALNATLAGPVVFTHRKRLIDFTVKNRLPAIYGRSEYVDDGGLMLYGTSIINLGRRAATYVDRILKGAKPADLPVEQPTKFELIINLKTAKQIGLTIPPNVLARADRVIR
jgi:putative ABC transport system substrate-binding protein